MDTTAFQSQAVSEMLEMLKMANLHSGKTQPFLNCCHSLVKLRNWCLQIIRSQEKISFQVCRPHSLLFSCHCHTTHTSWLGTWWKEDLINKSFWPLCSSLISFLLYTFIIKGPLQSSAPVSSIQLNRYYYYLWDILGV